MRFIVTGLVAGWIIGMVRRGKGYGLFGNLILGMVGSIVGWFLMGLMKIQNSTLPIQIGMAVAGAVVLFTLLGIIKGKPKNKRKGNDEN